MTTSYLIIQSLGVISMMIGWWAAKQTNDKYFISGNLSAAVITAIHFGLLGSHYAMLNQLLNAFRFYGASRFKCRAVFVLVIAMCLLQGYLMIDCWQQLAMMIATLISTYALFYCQTNKLRALFLVSTLLNLAMSVQMGSWSSIIYQVITVSLLAKQLINHYQNCSNTRLNKAIAN